MEKLQHEKVDQILTKAHHRDESMTKTLSQREWQLMIKRE